MEIKHESNNPPLRNVCSGANCDFAIDTSTGQGLCFSGSGTCLVSDLLEAEASDLHDKNLIEATRKIKQILAEIPADPNGRELSFLVTDMGLLLAWINHSQVFPANAVTAKDDKATVAKALKLKNWEAAGKQS